VTRNSLEPTRSRFGASLGFAALLCAVLAARGEEHALAALVALVGLLAVGLAVQTRVPRISGMLLALAVLDVAVVVPELGLRVLDFRFVSGVRFGYPTPADFREFAPDADLFWKLPADTPGVNSLGFIGPEPRRPKPAGTFRALFFGDSCLQQGAPEGVPELTAVLANSGRPPDDPRFESLNLAMSGYSSLQGARLAERVGADLDPDLVLVDYGWNDHWRAYGAEDRDKTVDVCRERWYRGSRLLQGLRWLAVRAGISGDAPPLDRNRVPLERYRENLATFSRLFAARGVPVVFVTAPSSHAARGVPDYLVRRGFAPDAATVLREHAQYNDVARAAAGTPGCYLLDLAAEFEAGEDPSVVFVTDGIHFNELGRRAAAGRIAAFLARAGLDGRGQVR